MWERQAMYCTLHSYLRSTPKLIFQFWPNLMCYLPQPEAFATFSGKAEIFQIFCAPQQYHMTNGATRANVFPSPADYNLPPKKMASFFFSCLLLRQLHSYCKRAMRKRGIFITTLILLEKCKLSESLQNQERYL